MSKNQNNKTKKSVRDAKSKFRKRVFVAALTNPDNPETFGNYTQAAKVANPNATRGSAANLGSKYMKDDYVGNEIERVIEAAGIGFVDRVNALRDIIFGDLTRESVTLVKDSETKSWKEVQKHVAPPSFTERLNAMKILNQIDGTDRRANQIFSHREKLLSQMRKKLLKDLEDSRQEVLRDVSDKLPKESEKIDSRESSSELDAFLMGDEADKSHDK
jgi:hypothetical protein